MAGVMGGQWRQLLGLRIWRINTKYNVLYVQGPVMPGPTHCYVRVSDSCLPYHREKITKDNHPPFPTYFTDDLENSDKQQLKLPEDILDKELHDFSAATIKFDDVEVKKVAPKREGAKLAKIKT